MLFSLLGKDPNRMLQDILNDMLKMTAKLIHEVFCLPRWEVIS
uniref:Alternative protein ZFP106 n=1 Tax=Homo sapiens TaxID=9606 RepID=L8EB46_HUMAN|nr:alternative protein ZFP106 [Homo sapiens]